MTTDLPQSSADSGTAVARPPAPVRIRLASRPRPVNVVVVRLALLDFAA